MSKGVQYFLGMRSKNTIYYIVIRCCSASRTDKQLSASSDTRVLYTPQSNLNDRCAENNLRGLVIPWFFVLYGRTGHRVQVRPEKIPDLFNALGSKAIDRTTNNTRQLIIVLFFFQLSFFLWIKLGLFVLFSFAFIFFSLIAHICFSLLENDLYFLTCARNPYRSGTHPNAILATSLSVVIDFPIPVFFCSDRQGACRVTPAILSEPVLSIVERVE